MNWMELFKNNDYESGKDKQITELTPAELDAQYYLNRSVRDTQLDDVNAYAIAWNYYKDAKDGAELAEKYAGKHQRRIQDVCRTEAHLQELQAQYQQLGRTPIGGFIDPFADI